MGGIDDLDDEMSYGTCTGVQAILRFGLCKFNGCNIGIRDGKEL
jgi:hypothetical protein